MEKICLTMAQTSEAVKAVIDEYKENHDEAQPVTFDDFEDLIVAIVDKLKLQALRVGGLREDV